MRMSVQPFESGPSNKIPLLQDVGYSLYLRRFRMHLNSRIAPNERHASTLDRVEEVYQVLILRPKY